MPVYVFDYGAPTGFRLAVKHPDRIAAIISQNGNAYEEGLSDGWNPIRAYWEDTSQIPRLPQAGDDGLAIHAGRSRSVRGFS
jgi:pimeloyl-ACP methyl ester carboxylesterase